ncbi:F-type H+-transporting ATPase subunit b [Marinobacter mobilis]|uniref:ATP synthase subunit b n=2 Tax=Marinobacter mobilis TaxID=488533 RepID=A0A1H3CZC2_9GAMM|nr:F-type H+-transporting ATPase subunit b [Marinobacter mobilis]
MEMSWSTFMLEIVNFVILIWILKRFLYKPVLEVIDQRRKNIEQQLAEVQQQQAQAKSLQGRYQDRLADWEQQRQQLESALSQELQTERAKQSGVLQSQLEQEREKARRAIKHQQAEVIRQSEIRALHQGARFASRLLEAAAGPELEARLLSLTAEELSQLPDATRDRIRSQWGEPPSDILVTSAYPLAEKDRQPLEQALRESLGLTAPISYQQDPELVAGIRINVGPWMLNTNVRDELNGFTEFSHGFE